MHDPSLKNVALFTVVIGVTSTCPLELAHVHQFGYFCFRVTPWAVNTTFCLISRLAQSPGDATDCSVRQGPHEALKR